MGVDMHVCLPARVRVADVAKVMGALAGLKPERRKLAWSDGFYVRVPGVRVTTMADDTPETADIVLTPLKGQRLVDSHAGFSETCFYHFETETGERLMMPSSTPFWVAVMRGVVDFFGGRMWYSDYDTSGPPDYERPTPAGRNIHATNGEEWDDLMLAILALEPVTKEQMKDAAKVAAYK